MLLALHLSALLAKAYRNFNRFRRWPLANSDFALQEHHKGFLDHGDNGDTHPPFGSGARGQSQSDVNRANKLLDCFGVGDDADLAGCHRPFFDTGPLLEQRHY